VNSNLDYLRESTRELPIKQTEACDNFLIGVLSCSVSDQAWKDAVDHAVRLASKRAASPVRILRGT